MAKYHGIDIPALCHLENAVSKGSCNIMVWMAFHFTEGNANWLTNSALDTFTLTAEYKVCAVQLEKIE